MAPKSQKNLAFSVLLDYYGPVLTDKQRAILTEYYDQDLSLAEIAENYGISRQGVRDAIKHGEAALTQMEERLGYAKREAAQRADLDRLERWLWRCAAATPGSSPRCPRSPAIPTRCLPSCVG